MTDASPAAKSASRADGFPLLDSIRAIAALSIVAYHSASAADAPATTFTSRLNTGVNLFFLLSAFLLYRPFVRARLRCERVPSVSRYGWRRFLRIVPAYWVALTVAALVFSQRDTFGHHGLLYFGFGQIYTQQTALGGLLVAWSLCVEVTLYAFLPLWAFTMRLRRPVDTRGRFRMELLGILALLAFSIVFKATYVNANQAGGAGIRLAQALPRYMDAFAIGMLLALLSAWYEDRRLPRPLRVVDRFPVVPWLLAAGVFWVLCTQVGLPRNPFNFVKLDLPQIVARDVLRTLFAALLLVPCVFGDQTRGVLRRILRSRTLLYVGVVSYGVYLWHLISLHYIEQWNIAHTIARTIHVGEWPVVVVLNTLAAVGLATLSYRLIERPALSLRNAPWRLPRQAKAPTPAVRVTTAVWGIVLIAIGMGGVGYRFLNTILIGSGVVLIAVAVPLRPALAMRLPAVTRVAAVVAVFAALIPTVLAPIERSTSVAEAATTGGRVLPVTTRVLPVRTYLVVTYDGKQLRIYVNGVRRASRPVSGPVGRGAPVTEIGSFTGHHPWSGTIDDVALYGTAIPAATVASHYKLGIKDGLRYAPAVRGTPGVLSYWRLDDTGKVVRDSVGPATGQASKQGLLRGWGGLITHDPDKATLFDGRTGSLHITHVPQVSKAFSLEAWVEPGAAVSARTVAARVGSWFMQTDVLGHWAAGFANHGKFISVAAPVGAHPNRPAPATKPAPTTTATPSPGGGGGGGGSNLALLALLAAVGLTVAALPTWRRRRDGGDSSASAPDDDSEPPSESGDETEDSEEREHDGAPV